MAEFDIEIYYNGTGIGDLDNQAYIDICMDIGQQIFDLLQPVSEEIDEHGGIRIDITDKDNSEQPTIAFDYRDLPSDLIEKIEALVGVEE